VGESPARIHGVDPRAGRNEHDRHQELPSITAVNPPTPPDTGPKPTLPTEADVARLRAWHELQAHMEDLHARLQYLRLMLKLGVGGR